MGIRQIVLLFILLTLTILLASCQVAKPPTPAPVPEEPTPSPIPTERETAPPPTPTRTPRSTPTPIPAPSLPAWCGEVGAQGYKEPLPTISLPTIVLERGTVITVTTVSDAIDVKVSSVRALLANPGPDGLALRQALEATNSDPGIYTIRFAPQLKGMTIKVGSWNQSELPFLTGGSVIINGDIDGDGGPDVTLKNATQGLEYTVGLRLSSGGNVIHALTIEDFKVGVLFRPHYLKREGYDLTPFYRPLSMRVFSLVSVNSIGLKLSSELCGLTSL